jgi:hypothetical protein
MAVNDGQDKQPGRQAVLAPSTRLDQAIVQ